MTYFVYILECADATLYCGCTNNLKRRIYEHNNSKRAARYTRNRRPVVVIYSEQFETLKHARRREAEIKRLTRKEKLELVRGKFKSKIK